MYYLGLDYGGTQIKAALYDEQGYEIMVFGQPTAAQTPAPQIVEIDMLDLWRCSCQCIRQLLDSAKEKGIYAADISGIAPSSHGKGLYLLDAHGLPCGKGILSSDTRSSKLLQSWREQGLCQAASPFILQEIWPSHSLAILGFLSQEQPQLLENCHSICMGHDYLRYCLTGEIAAERSNISGSGLVDIRSGTYSDEILELTQLQELKAKLPPIIDSAELCGHVHQEAAQATGLLKGTPVYGGFFDVVGAAVASGLQQETDYHAIMGTWSISTCLASKLPDSKGPVSIPWGSYAALPQTYFAHDGSPSSAGNLNWFLEQFAPKQRREKPHPDFEYNDQVIQNIRPEQNDLFFFPYLYAANLGRNMPGSLIGLQGNHTYSDVLYAIYEGILFAHKIHLDKLATVQPKPERLLLTGGPSQSNPWMQMFADFTGLPVWTLEDTKESGCKSGAMAAAVGSGLFGNFQDAMASWVRYRQPLLPRAERNEPWQTKYQRYLALGNNLASFFD